MKSSYWTLCFLALFVCFTEGTSENLDNKETFLDTGDSLFFEEGEKDSCVENTDCTGNRFCEGGFCICKPGYDGDECTELTGCTTELKTECEDAKATCVYFDTDPYATCECKAKGYKFVDRKCKLPCTGENSCTGNRICEGGFCKCKPGYEGDECTELTGCTTELKTECEDAKARCVYSETAPYATCECTEPDYTYKESKCKQKCDDAIKAKKCQNSGSCEEKNSVKTCSCKPGTSGDFCQTIDKCKDLECGNDATCVFDGTENVMCKCNNTELSFDKSDRKCKATCDDSIEAKKCQNGGSCKEIDSGKFCSCRNGTSGDFCQTAAKCNGVDCGKEAKCVLDESEKAMCKCKQIDSTFDESAKKCRVDYCKKNCKGEGVTCDESKRFDKNVECTCSDVKQSFDSGECKDDYCKKNCGSYKDGDESIFVIHESVKCEPKQKFNSSVQCKCKESRKQFDKTVGQCKTPCKDKAPCLNNGECTKGDDSEHSFCVCKEGTSGDMCNIVNDCQPGGKWAKCKGGSKGKCIFNVKEDKAQCKCNTDKTQPSEKMQFCVDTCNQSINCTGKNRICNNGLCECKDGYNGDQCNELTGCTQELKNQCKKVKATCVYDKEHPYATCKCTESDYTYKDSKCKQICSTKKPCIGNRNCENSVCECKPGYDGDGCTELKGCTTELKEKCKQAEATCVYDNEHPYATCECKVSGYVYEDEKCEHNFCKTNACNGATCVFDNTVKAAYCNCSSDAYYDYNEQQCTKPDACLLTKCKENEVCKDGACKCPYELQNDTCIKKDDCDNACFEGAKCSKGICVCGDGEIYVNNECQSGSCISKDFEIKCECPDKFARKENKPCKLKEDPDYKSCSKDCGFGLCYKESNDEEFCECFNDKYVEEKNGKCVLKVDACESQTLTEDSMKCKCIGIYKQAKNGITCELVTCEDKILSNLCQSYNAPCKMRWKDIPDKWTLDNYCECPTGYVQQDKPTKKCIDICSTENVMLECMKKDQLCYHSVSDGNEQKAKEHVTDCRCLPPLMEDANGKCAGLSENVYMIKNIPIMKAKYVSNGKVDSVLLNMDIIDSLRQTYGADMLNYGYLYDFNEKGDVLNCNVWIAFKKDASDVKERIRLQSQKFTKEACTDGTKCLEAMIWPPSILMSESLVKDVAVEDLTFCDFAKDLLCGENTDCKDNKTCVCKPGFQAPTMAMRVFGDVVVQRCEDIDECATKTHDCPKNTTCENTLGSYRCVCEPGFKKEVESTDKNDKGICIELCSTSPSPCGKGSCSVVNNTVDCKCEFGYTGSFCNRKDVNLASAKKQVVVVGAVLGTILGVALIGFILFYRKVRKSSHSQDFTPAPRRDNAEMMERRPMRGVVNKSYE